MVSSFQQRAAVFQRNLPVGFVTAVKASALTIDGIQATVIRDTLSATIIRCLPPLRSSLALSIDGMPWIPKQPATVCASERRIIVPPCRSMGTNRPHLVAHRRTTLDDAPRCRVVVSVDCRILAFHCRSMGTYHVGACPTRPFGNVRYRARRRSLLAILMPHTFTYITLYVGNYHGHETFHGQETIDPLLARSMPHHPKQKRHTPTPCTKKTDAHIIPQSPQKSPLVRIEETGKCGRSKIRELFGSRICVSSLAQPRKLLLLESNLLFELRDCCLLL